MREDLCLQIENNWSSETGEGLLALGSGGVGCLSIQARRFTGESFSRVELELPKGNIGWEVMHSCNAWIMTGGGGTTILAAMACHSSL